MLTTLAMLRSLWKLPPRTNERQIFLGAAIVASLAGQAVCAMFGDYLDGEWFLWLGVFGIGYAASIEDEQFMINQDGIPDTDLIPEDEVAPDGAGTSATGAH